MSALLISTRLNITLGGKEVKSVPHGLINSRGENLRPVLCGLSHVEPRRSKQYINISVDKRDVVLANRGKASVTLQIYVEAWDNPIDNRDVFFTGFSNEALHPPFVLK